MSDTDRREEMKRLIVESLGLEGIEPGSIEDEEPLFGGRLGLDSVDALELVLALERRFGIKVQSHEVDRDAFATVAALTAFVAEHEAASGPDAQAG